MMLCVCYTDNQAWLMIYDTKKLSPIPEFGICAVFRHRAKKPGQVALQQKGCTLLITNMESRTGPTPSGLKSSKSSQNFK